MRLPTPDSADQANARIIEPTEAPVFEADPATADWRELGRRVLSEAMKRSMRDLRRRNGITGGLGMLRRGREGRS